MPVTVACYYFGNYHPGDPRNVQQKGPIWSEWELVKSARPRFPGHAQPNVPLWGYTDESDPRAMAQKIAAAADHGIDAFIFDWYYYNDGPFLERPIDHGFLRAANNHRLKFALMWANHDWVDIHPHRRDTTAKVLYPGAVTPVTFDRICDHVIVPGETAVQNPAALIQRLGFDSVTSYVWIHHVQLPKLQTDYEWVRDQYFKYWNEAEQQFGVPYFPNVTMGWDSSPRAAQADEFGNFGYPFTNTISNNTPAQFRQALEQTKRRLLAQAAGPRIVTINCWNEWTEGSYLEPDTVHELQYLEAVAAVFQS